MQPHFREITITSSQSFWQVRIVDASSTQVFTCPTEQSALHLAGVFQRADAMLEAA